MVNSKVSMRVMMGRCAMPEISLFPRVDATSMNQRAARSTGQGRASGAAEAANADCTTFDRQKKNANCVS